MSVPVPPAWITATRKDVIARLCRAIAVAPAFSPLRGIKLPENRWTRFKPDTLPGMFVRVARVRRQVIGTNVPLFDYGASIEVHAAVAALEAAAECLDDQLEAIFDQVDLVLLEDPEFVKKFTAVESADVEFDDAEGSEYFVRVGMVTYTVSVEQEFEPRVGNDALEQVAATAPFAPVQGGDPDEQHEVGAAIVVPQE